MPFLSFFNSNQNIILSNLILLFSRSVMSDFLWRHELQHARLPCPSLSPRVCLYSCPLSLRWLPSNHLILCCPLLLLPSIYPSLRIFTNESTLRIRWPKYWNFIISPFNEYSGLLSFRIDWFDLLAVQGTLKSLIQHHSLKHQFFSTQQSLWSSSHIHTWLLEKP